MKMTQADPVMLTARALLDAGEMTAAIEQLRRVLDNEPRRLDALTLLGHTFVRGGQFEQARIILERAHDVAPDDIGILHVLGGACHQVGMYDRAQVCLENATRRMPGDPRLWCSLGLVRHGAGYYQAAIEAYDQALQIDPGHTDAQAGKGKVLQLLGELDLARESFNAALDSHPLCVPARVGLGTGLEMEGRYRDAVDVLTPVLEAIPANPELALLWGRLLANDNQAAEARIVLENLLSQPLADADRSHACFALGDLLDAQADYEAAGRCYISANQLKTGEFDRSRYADRVSSTIMAWTESAMADLAGVNNSERPIFIVGMPRSGTSLVEQILARHPGVYAAGELT
ncbi:MAG: tetratricopeptide repeat protein, partial [Gammaproteobacteria bacterium]